MADAGTTTADGDAADEAPEVDEAREGVLATLTDALGDALLDSHIDPGHALWVRVERDAWATAAEHAKLRLGFTFFDFLSAIDWMPSPWGRYEDRTVDDGATPFAPTAPVDTGLGWGGPRVPALWPLARVRRVGRAIGAEPESLRDGA